MSGSSIPSSPVTFARYRLLGGAVRGGMAEVYPAQDPVRGRPVALKRLNTSHRDPDDRRRFEREIRFLGSLQHEGIVRLHDAGRLDGELYYSMEYLEGIEWERLLDRPPPDIREIRWTVTTFSRLLLAVSHLHRSRLLHRDLKPSNVLLLPAGTSADRVPARPWKIPEPEDILRDPAARVKLLDFGLAIGLDERRDPAAKAPGTPLYMAPERADGTQPLDPRSDLYSLGVFLYRAITRRFPCETWAQVVSERHRPVPPSRLNPQCPEALSDLILRQLSRDVSQRAPSADELRRQLLGCDGEAGEPPARLHIPVFCGRVQELDRLDRAVAIAQGGGRSLVLVHGEPGTGKSWLLDRSGFKVRAVLDRSLNYVEGRYDPGGPLHQGLRTLIGLRMLEIEAQMGTERLRSELGPSGGALLETLGLDGDLYGPVMTELARLLGPPPPALPADALRDATTEAAVRLLSLDGGNSTRLVVLRNLHLAEELDLEVLRRLLVRDSDVPLAVVATHDSRPQSWSPVFERWLRHMRQLDSDRVPVEEIPLGPLSDQAVEALIESMLESPARPDATLLQYIHGHARGRPAAVVATMQDLWSEGRISRSGHRWVLHRPVEDDATATASSGVLDPLSPGQRSILGAAAVIGVEFQIESLAQILGTPGDPEVDLARLRREIDDLTDQGLLDSTGDGHRFTAPSLRTRCLELQSQSARRACHLRLARYLAGGSTGAEGEPWSAAADHFRLAGEPALSAEYHLKFARYAAGRGAHHRALQGFRQALELLSDPAEQSGVLEELARINTLVGEQDAALECLGRAAALRAEGPDLIPLLEEEGRIHQRRGEPRRAESLFRHGLRLAGDEEKIAARLRYRLGSVKFDRNELDGAAEHFDGSLETYRRLGDLDGMATVLLGRGLVEKRRGDLDAAVRHIRESIACSEKAGRLHQVAASLNNLANLYRVRGDHAEAIKSFRRSLSIRESLGDRLGRAICLSNLSRAFWYRGEVGNAANTARESFDLFREIGDSRGVLIAGANLGGYLLFRGGIDSAREMLDQNLALARSLEDRRGIVNALHSLGLLESAYGDLESAARRLAEGVPHLDGVGDPSLETQFLAELCLSRLRLGDRGAAREALARGRECARNLDSDEPRGWLLLAESELLYHDDELDNALARATEGLKALEGAGSRADCALANRQVGRIYRELGPDWVDRTEFHFEVAHSALEEMGARVELAITLVEEARLWSHLEEPEEAAALLEEAILNFRECGASARAGATEEERRSLS